MTTFLILVNLIMTIIYPNISSSFSYKEKKNEVGEIDQADFWELA